MEQQGQIAALKDKVRELYPLLQRHRGWIATGILLLTIFTVAMFSGVDKSDVAKTLDARDAALSQKDIDRYERLIYAHYEDHGKNRDDVVEQMAALFNRFDRVEMKSYDRSISEIKDGFVRCEQSYILKVLADGDWRKIVQREQLTLTKTKSGWKISAGL